jgi:hypothetical protein
MSDENKKEDSTVSFRVFLPDSLRTEFKVWCARKGTNMSEKSRELIEEWVKSKASQGGK